MSTNNPIDDYFKRSLEKHEVKASPEVWERVAAATGSESRKGMAWYIMRAAVVVLMFSIGTWFVTDYSDQGQGLVVSPDTELENNNPNTTQKGQNTNQAKSTTEPKENSKAAKENEKKKRTIPIMKQSQSRGPLYVSNDPVIEVDEASLYDHSEVALATIELDPSQLAAYGMSSPSLKLKLTGPATESAFYAGAEVEEEDLKTKLYAYANTQFDNIRNGRPLELPRTGKPQLQINLNRIFNN